MEQPDFPTPVTPKPTAPLHISEGVQPTQVTQLSSGHWFFDFGTELMAGLRLEVPGGAAADGWVLQMVLGEELSAPNTVMYPMRTGNTYANTFTLRSGVSVFQHHEYMLFRYGELRFLNASVQCGVAEENSALELSCAGGQTISAVTFASYGTPGGSCGSSFSVNSSCNAASSAKVVEGLCLGKPRCTITASNSVFGGDPCHLTAKRLAAAVTCSAGRRADGAASPAPAAPSLNFTLTAWQVQYPWNESESHFSSSSPMLNQVYELCRNTLRVTSLDTFTDSNTRERLPYEADQFITAHSRSVFQRGHLLARHSARHNILNPTLVVLLFCHSTQNAVHLFARSPSLVLPCYCDSSRILKYSAGRRSGGRRRRCWRWQITWPRASWSCTRTLPSCCWTTRRRAASTPRSGWWTFASVRGRMARGM